MTSNDETLGDTTNQAISIPFDGLGDSGSAQPSIEASGEAVPALYQAISDEGLELLRVSLMAAAEGDVVSAGESVWEMSEDDVNAGLQILSVVTQALLAQGTNYQIGRNIKATGLGSIELYSPINHNPINPTAEEMERVKYPAKLINIPDEPMTIMHRPANTLAREVSSAQPRQDLLDNTGF